MGVVGRNVSWLAASFAKWALGLIWAENAVRLLLVLLCAVGRAWVLFRRECSPLRGRRVLQRVVFIRIVTVSCSLPIIYVPHVYAGERSKCRELRLGRWYVCQVVPLRWPLSFGDGRLHGEQPRANYVRQACRRSGSEWQRRSKPVRERSFQRVQFPPPACTTIVERLFSRVRE